MRKKAAVYLLASSPDVFRVLAMKIGATWLSWFESQTLVEQGAFDSLIKFHENR